MSRKWGEEIVVTFVGKNMCECISVEFILGVFRGGIFHMSYRVHLKLTCAPRWTLWEVTGILSREPQYVRTQGDGVVASVSVQVRTRTYTNICSQCSSSWLGEELGDGDVALLFVDSLWYPKGGGRYPTDFVYESWNLICIYNKVSNLLS